MRLADEIRLFVEDAEGVGVVVDTILKQLGGAGRLRAMIRAKDIGSVSGASGPGVWFKFAPGKAPGWNNITITLRNDTYTLRFGKGLTGKTKEIRDVYVGQLRDVFERETGLLLSL